MSIVTPAMKARLALPIPPQYDTRRSHILVFAKWVTGEHVRAVLPIDRYAEGDWFSACYEAAEEQAESLWRMKYGVEMPAGDVDMAWVETISASAFPYDGPTTLTVEEQSIVSTDDFGDFTLDMLWLMVEGLGWRPGKPVAEDDPGWLAIWAEEENCRCYLDIVRAVLGMPDTPAPIYGRWKPPVVMAAYSQATNA